MKNFVCIICLLVVFGIYCEAASTEKDCTDEEGKLDYCCVADEYEEDGHMNDDGRLLLDVFVADANKRAFEAINSNLSNKKAIEEVLTSALNMLNTCISKANKESDRCAVVGALAACVERYAREHFEEE